MCFSFLFLRKVNGFQPVDRSSDQWSDNLFSTPMFGVVVAQYAKFVFKRQSCADAGVMNSDILISLCDEDTDNYVICQLGKQMFGVKKCICIVKNPKNVDTFKRLGIENLLISAFE